MSIPDRVHDLDTTLFDGIHSQTTPEDRRALLLAQDLIASRTQAYTYLEIGSHLGGSIQPHLLDDRCQKIYSIDPRPSSHADDRKDASSQVYEDNSTQRMLDLLATVDPNATGKITFIEQTSSDVPVADIAPPADIAFIDGEHTSAAVMEDFEFCRRVTHGQSVILFHDSWIIYPAITAILKKIKSEQTPCISLLLDGDVFAIFFDTALFHKDPVLQSLYKNRRGAWRYYLLKQKVKAALPKCLVDIIRQCVPNA